MCNFNNYLRIQTYLWANWYARYKSKQLEENDIIIINFDGLYNLRQCIIVTV